ncbi:MAG: class A beta-lactamase-related serine hydrolase [Sphingobacteriales bacterium]|nr:MAG: class A beta-lactamase-related serine hydrolase [Sphingobacteriales bacterium]
MTNKFALLLLSCSMYFSIAAQDNAALRLEQLMKETPVMGLSVAVIKNNKPVYTEAFGLKNAASKVPLETSDIFRIASISKSFVATSIMQLVEKKKLKLDDDVSELVGFKVRNPKFPETVITLKMLLSHRSSLNDSRGYFVLDSLNPAKTANWEKCYNNYEPGKGYQYCNFNFNMAGAIIEKYSGERFDHYVKKHILDPLKLYGGYNVDDLDSSRLASIYEYKTDSAIFVWAPGAYASRKPVLVNYQLGYSTPVFSPTGGMKISAEGLAKYMTMHMNYGKPKGKRILKKASAQLMQTAPDTLNQYGLALLRIKTLIPGETMVGHTGSAYGLHSAMFFEPDKKFGIVVISNGCHPAYADAFVTVIKKTINILYEELIQ